MTTKTTKNCVFLMVFWSFWVLGPILAHQTAKFELSGQFCFSRHPWGHQSSGVISGMKPKSADSVTVPWADGGRWCISACKETISKSKIIQFLKISIGAAWPLGSSLKILMHFKLWIKSISKHLNLFLLEKYLPVKSISQNCKWI